MSQQPVLTCVLASGTAKVAYGLADCTQLIDEMLRIDHIDSESTLSIGESEFHRTAKGPYPNNQFRVSVRPSAGLAALSYTDHSDPTMPVAISFNSLQSTSDIHFIFSGLTGRIFPEWAAIPLPLAREALAAWLLTKKRPECIEWMSIDQW